jgi:hypothetical protein
LNGGMDTTGGTQHAEALMALLLPIWQLVIGVCVLLALVAACVRLAQRGRSRMGTVLAVFGFAIVGVALLGFLFGG